MRVRIQLISFGRIITSAQCYWEREREREREMLSLTDNDGFVNIDLA